MKNDAVNKTKKTGTAKTDAATDCKGREFVIRRTFEAPREMVFQAWIDPKQLAQWWGPRGFTNPVCEWEAQPGKRIYVVMQAPGGQRFPMGGEFREVVPPERLVFTSGAMDENGALLFEFLHTATLVERNGKTDFTFRSVVTRTTPGANKYIGGFEAGMTQSLERLTELLAGKAGPLIVERVFEAPVALVWDALTDKDKIREWSFEIKEFKAEAGFEFEFYGEKDGVKYHHRSKITEVIPNRKLAYTWRYVGHEGDSLVTFELFAEGDKTRVKLTHEGLETFPKTADFERKNFVAGWTEIIGRSLKEFVEKRSKG